MLSVSAWVGHTASMVVRNSAAKSPKSTKSTNATKPRKPAKPTKAIKTTKAGNGASPTRTRLSAEDAKKAILDVAERQLREVGPEGLRLQAIAEEVGVGHSALLYHFGSREAIVDAVVQRIVVQTFEREIDVVEQGVLDPQAAFDRLFETMGGKGTNRLLAWLALSGYLKSTKEHRAFWSKIINGAHSLREQAFPGAQHEETAFVIVMCALVLLGEEVVGDVTFQNAGLDKEARQRFHPWLVNLVIERLARA